MAVQICGGGGDQMSKSIDWKKQELIQLIDFANAKNDYKLADCTDVELKLGAVVTEHHPHTQNV